MLLTMMSILKTCSRAAPLFMFLVLCTCVVGANTDHWRPTVSIVPRVVKSWSCAGDQELFTQFLEVTLTVHNDSQTMIVVPVISNVVGRTVIGVSQVAIADGKYEMILDPEYIYAGKGRVPAADDFVTVAPSQDRELPMKLRVMFQALMPGAAINGIVKPGKKWLAFTWTPWSGGRSAADAWRRKFADRGELLTRSMWTEPVEIVVPAKPVFTSCKN
jgi:hypothetical protein